MRGVSLPGIYRIGLVELSSLSPQLELKSIAGLPLGVFTEVDEIGFIGEATCETESEYDNHGRIDKTTLKFRTTAEIPESGTVGFIVWCVNGKRYLLGRRERPYPTVKVKQHMGTVSGEASVEEVEITLTGLKTLLPVCV